MILLFLALFLLSILNGSSASGSPGPRAVQNDPSWKDSLLGLHRQLVEIPSLSGDERAVGDWLADHLDRLGFEVTQQHIPGERGVNVLAVAPGQSQQDHKQPSNEPYDAILVTSHIDTVPPFIPYSFDPETEIIAGRGSVDAKASVAAQIVAVSNIIAADRFNQDTNSNANSDRLPIHLLFVIEEETTGAGMRHYSAHYPPGVTYTHTIFGEPTWGKLAVGHKGLMMARFDVVGKAAHSGYPWLGLSAVDVIVDVIATVRHAVASIPSSRRFGNTTVNFGELVGGVAANVVADHASAHAVFRLGQDAGSDGDGDDGGVAAEVDAVDAVRALIGDALGKITADTKSKGGNVIVQWELPSYGPVSLDTDVDGFDTVVASYGTDVPNWTGPGSDRKRYLYGPGSILVAHGPHEALTVKDLVDSVDGYERLIRHALASGSGERRVENRKARLDL